MNQLARWSACLLFAVCTLAAAGAEDDDRQPHAAEMNERPRARALGIEIGILPPGRLNAITDVEGVAVGHQTMIEGDDVRTGVTVVVPHGGNLFQEKVPAAVVVGNGFGKLVGSTQVEELGVLETPIVPDQHIEHFRRG